MSDKTFAERLDAARSGDEFAQVLNGLFSTLERLRDEQETDSCDR